MSGVQCVERKGKKLYDKREAAAEKSAKREMDRAIKENGRY